VSLHWNDLYPRYATFVAGFLGALIQLSFAPKQTFFTAATKVGIGTIAAIYVTPVALRYFGWPEPMQGGVAFLIGLFAMNMIPKIIQMHPWFLPEQSPGAKGKTEA